MKSLLVGFRDVGEQTPSGELDFSQVIRTQGFSVTLSITPCLRVVAGATCQGGSLGANMVPWEEERKIPIWCLPHGFFLWVD